MNDSVNVLARYFFFFFYAQERLNCRYLWHDLYQWIAERLLYIIYLDVAILCCICHIYVLCRWPLSKESATISAAPGINFCPVLCKSERETICESRYG